MQQRRPFSRGGGLAHRGGFGTFWFDVGRWTARTTRSWRRPLLAPMTWGLPRRARQLLSAREADSRRLGCPPLGSRAGGPDWTAGTYTTGRSTPAPTLSLPPRPVRTRKEGPGLPARGLVSPTRPVASPTVACLVPSSGGEATRREQTLQATLGRFAGGRTSTGLWHRPTHYR